MIIFRTCKFRIINLICELFMKGKTSNVLSAKPLNKSIPQTIKITHYQHLRIFAMYTSDFEKYLHCIDNRYRYIIN